MKSFYIAILLFLTAVASYGQQQPPYGELLLTDTLKFSPLHAWINIPESNTTWEIGFPSKDGMNDSHDGFPTIVTKLADNYPLSSNDYFDVELPYYNQTWGEGILSFWHKFDTDTLKDGGIIEVSSDGGTTWTNLAAANIGISHNYSGLYTINDTITGKMPAFTGRSMTWKKVELYWFWLGLTKRVNDVRGIILRFKFHSGNTSTPKGGWQISNMVLKAYHITGNVAGNANDGITLFPNPTKDRIKLTFANFSSNLRFTLYTQTGIRLFDHPILSEVQDINLEQYSSGAYIYTINQGNTVLKAGVFMKE